MSDLNNAKRMILAQYEKERDELNHIISRLRRDLGIDGDVVVTPETAALKIESTAPSVNIQQLIKPGDLFGMTQVEAAKKVLQVTGRRPLTLQDIAGALYRGKATETLIEGASLRNLSSLLSRSDDLISVAKGRWGLSEWYPNRSKKSRKAKDDNNVTKPEETDKKEMAQ